MKPEKHADRWLVLVWMLAFAPILLLGVLVAVSFAVAMASEATRATMVVEILRVTIAWPMVVLAIAIVFGLAFRDEIASSMSRLAVKVGGVEISTQPKQELTSSEAAALPAPSESGAGVGGVASANLKVPAAAAPAPEPAAHPTAAAAAGGDVAAALTKAQELSAWRMRMWWFWWLQSAKQSLVPRTVGVLRWLVGQPGGSASYEAYEQRWKPEIAPELAQQQLATMIDVLQQLDMVTAPPSREVVTIADSGRKFLDYLDGIWNPVNDPSIA